MRRLDTAPDGPALLEPEVHGDARGFFLETFRATTMGELPAGRAAGTRG